MKPSKSPENAEVTPSKKKLKQARLPFKLISEASPTPVTPQTRKRKLSAADAETVTKIGKLSKENDLVEQTVVISDDEASNNEPAGQEKPLNPFVKLVDTAWKKKLQKSKKKKNGKKSTEVTNESTESVSNGNHTIDSKNEVESMDVDSPVQEDDISNNEKVETNLFESEKPSSKTKKATPKRRNPRKSRESPRNISKGKQPTNNSRDVVVVEDSNMSDKLDQNKDNSEVIEKENKQSEAIPSNADTKTALLENSNAKEANHVSVKETSLEEDTKENASLESEEPAVKPQQIEEKTSESPEEESDEETTENSGAIEEKVLVTPKRSARNKTKTDEKDKSLNKSVSKLDESASSNPSTPKQNRSLSVTTSLDESLNESTASANLTPKQLQKKLEAAKKREDRDKEKQEREKKRQQEKEERAKQKQEKEEQRKREKEEKEEAKRKEKEEKEELRRKEKEEKDRQKELEKKLREEKEEQKRKEKEEKEEQKRKEKEAREEERRKKQEALEQEKQEQELKKKKAAEAFANFFVPKQKSEKDQPTLGPVSKSSVLSSFAIKSDMRLAPTIRVNLSDEKKQTLDTFLEKQDVNKSGLYLNNLKDGSAKPLSDGKTWPLSDKDDDDVMIVEDELPPLDGAGEIITCDSAAREKLRPKLLSFHKNRRPPYWGTWRKKSADVGPRRPFGQDKKHLDYEVDSDEEWEEEPEGESVDGSAAGSDVEEDGDEYEVDNELFVPHGYLSDEEATMDDDDVLSLSPETQKARLKHLEDEFESEMKKPTEKLKPRLYGILWENEDGGKPDNCVDALWNYFSKLAMIMNDPTPLLQPSNEPEEAEKKKVKKKKVANEGEKQSPKSEKKKKAKTENKESKSKIDPKKNNTPEIKKNQPGINSFLTKLKST